MNRDDLAGAFGPRDPRPFEPSSSWPPPVSRGDQYETVVINGVDDTTGWPRGFRVSLRAARLWGARVLIDTAGDVFCPACKVCVPVAELVRADNKHDVGLPRIPGAMTPITGPDPRPTTSDNTWP